MIKPISNRPADRQRVNKPEKWLLDYGSTKYVVSIYWVRTRLESASLMKMCSDNITMYSKKQL